MIGAFVLSLLYFTRRNRKSLPVSDRFKSAGLGVLGIGLYSLSIGIGEQTVPAGVSGFIVGQMPLITAVLASFFLKEKITMRLSLGIGFSLLGLFFITLGEFTLDSLETGLLFVLFSAFAGALYTCFQKPLLKRVSILDFLFHAIWGATFFLTVMTIFSPVHFFEEVKLAGFSGLSSVVYLGCFPTILAYLGWSYAVARLDVAKAGILLYGMPVVGGLLAWILLSEKPQPIALMGMFLAFSGSLVGTLKIGKKKATSLQEAALKIK